MVISLPHLEWMLDEWGASLMLESPDEGSLRRSITDELTKLYEVVPEESIEDRPVRSTGIVPTIDRRNA